MDHYPAPGTELYLHRGDCVTFRLENVPNGGYRGCLRTNLGYAGVRRREIIRQAEEHEPILARDWHDIDMRHVGRGAWEATVPVLETGYFEAKAFALNATASQAAWPAGPAPFEKGSGS